MKQILDRIQQHYEQTDNPGDFLNYYKKQFDQEFSLSGGPDWIFNLLDHFQSIDESQLKQKCCQDPKLTNELLSYLENRYKYSQILSQGLRKPWHSLRLLQQRLEFNTTTYYPFAHELQNAYFESRGIQQTYNTYHRSDTLLSKAVLFIYRGLSTLIAVALAVSSIPFTLYLATGLNILLSQIEWGFLHLASGGEYTQNLQDLCLREERPLLNKERLFLRLCDGLEESRYPDIDSIEKAKQNYLESTKKWPINEHGNSVPMADRERIWPRHCLSICREQDKGLNHLFLIIKTFYDLTMASLKSSFLGFQGLELFFRLRYVLFGLIFLTLALGIQSLTEYLPNMVMSVLVLASLVVDTGLYYLFVAPFYEGKHSLQLNQSSQQTPQYISVASPVKQSGENPQRSSANQADYFFNRCKTVRTRLSEDHALLTSSPMATKM